MSDDFERRATVGEAHVTGKTAELIFQRSLPHGWLPRKQDPDFHIDYKVEVVEAGELTGVHFGVQLKGWTPKTGRKKGPRYSLSTKHLRYYVEKCIIPIFLVIVDVTTEQCYGVFVQQYAKEKLPSQMSPKQKTVTIHFAAEDALRKETLLEIVTKANAYVRELHPGSVQAAVAHQKAQLEAKYPQHSFDLHYNGGKVQLDVQPKGPMPLKIRVAKGAHLAAIQEFFEKGKDTEIPSSGIQFIGSAFLDEHVNGKAGVIQFSKAPVGRGEAQISWVDEKNDPRFIVIPGQFKSGNKFITFEGALDGSPLSLENWFTPQAWTQGQPPNGQFGFNVTAWHGKKVRALPYFEPIRMLFARTQTGLPLRFALFREGNSLGGSSFREPEPKRLDTICKSLDFLEKARVVAKHLDLNPCLPTRIPEEDFLSILELYDLIANKRHEYSVSGQSCLVQTHRPLEDGELAGLTLTVNAELDKVYSVLDSCICVGPIRETTADMKFLSKQLNEKGETEYVFAQGSPTQVIATPAADVLKKQPLKK